MGKIYGYIRILTEGQDVENQIIMLLEVQVREREEQGRGNMAAGGRSE